MKIVKLAGKFTDDQLWMLHGVHPDEYRKEFAPIKAKKNEMIVRAVKEAEALRHKLFKNWTPVLNSNRCRKCGLTVSLPNVFTQTSAPDAIGGAVTQPCFVHLEGVPADMFDITDAILDDGVEVNKDQSTAIAGTQQIAIRLAQSDKPCRHQSG